MTPIGRRLCYGRRNVANIAARVQALAEVQRQVAGLFVAEERGTQTLKGVREPPALFRLVRASGGGRRSGQRNLTPLVGRDEEIVLLMRRWERARRGERQLTRLSANRAWANRAWSRNFICG